MTTLFLLRGLPGSGKTTLAEVLFDLHYDSTNYMLSSDGVLCVSADDFMVDAQGNYLWQPDLLGDCHRNCLSSAVEAMAHGAIVIVHNTFTREKELAPYEEAAKEYGYRVVRLVVENTHGNTSVHNVPAKTMQSMRDRFSLKL